MMMTIRHRKRHKMTRCSVCRSKDIDRITKALKAGTPVRSIARTFRLSKDAITRCKRNHLRIATKSAVPAKVAAVDDVTFRDATDVLRQIEVLYGETMRMFRLAVDTSDTRLAMKALDGGATLLEKLSKTFGLFQADGSVIVNVNTIEHRIERALEGLSENELRSLLKHNVTLEDLLEINSAEIIEHE